MVTNFFELFVTGADQDPAVIEVAQDARARSHSKAQLVSRARAIAARLGAEGLPPQSAVAILGGNGFEYLASFLGILSAGHVAVPINTRLPEEQIAWIFKDAAVVRALCDGGLRAPLSVPIIPFGSVSPDVAAGGWSLPAQARADDVACLLYTSGSTGRPKGVVHTHQTLTSIFTGGGRGDLSPFAVRGVVAAPMYHMNGLTFALLLVAAGGVAVTLAKFDVETFLQAIDSHRVAVVTGVPTMLAMIAQRPELVAQRDLSAVRRVQLASAPLTQDLLERTQEIFPNATVANIYGSTEAGVPFSAHPTLPTPSNSVGCAAAHAEVRLVDGPSEDEGVLQVRSAGLMAGYWQRPDLTEGKIRDGWYHSGDVFRRDAEGFYYFVGREDDMFVCGGENIFPGEVEALLGRMPGVAQACVVAAPDDIKGAVPVAFVVPQAGASLTAEAVKAFALGAGPAYIHPRQVHLVDDLPLTGVNKIDRRALERAALEGRGGVQS